MIEAAQALQRILGSAIWGRALTEILMENPESKRFGRYEIVGELGRGAMGVVYKAKDPQIDRIVALKTVALRGQEPEEEEEFRKRFLNEAQAAGRLHHPGIVAVFDVGENPENHDPYIVLECVSGEALNRILAREKKLPLATALQLTEEIAQALDYAHAQGVVHRDIKPGNILVTQDGHAKIADFGIAKLNLAHFTLPGRVLGTPAYMAPEQLSGEGADGRSDLFSLGVILYAMVTGHSPFQGNSATTVCFKVANREPLPASALDLNLPPELDAVISRAMAKDPKERYARGSEFADDVRKLLVLSQPGSTTTSLAAVSGSGTRKNKAATTGGSANGMAYAAKFIRAEILKSPIRDIALGLGTIVLLVVVGVQSKLLVFSHQAAASAPPTTVASKPVASKPDKLRTQPIPAAKIQPAAADGSPDDPASASVEGTGTPPADKSAAPIASTKPAKSSKGPVREVVVPSSTVELAVRNQFKDATFTFWVDGKLALTRELHGGAQKRLVMFNSVRGIESETLKVPAGQHTLRFRTQSADQQINLSKTISAKLIGGDDKTLQITFDKHNTVMHLEWQ
jgi:serine/threonine protein kinase